VEVVVGGRSLEHEVAEERGFTLIELLVVVIIIGVLAAIAIPIYLNQRERAYDAMAQTDVQAMSKLQFAVLADGAAFASTIAELEAEGFRPSDAASTVHGVCVLNPGASVPEFVVGAAHTAGGGVWIVRSTEGGVAEGSTPGDLAASMADVDASCPQDTRP